MSELVQEITTEADFNAAIRSGVVLVDFFATWCMPCKMQTPILEQLAGELGDKVKIVKVDVDKIQSVAVTYDVSSIPTLVLFKDGQTLDRMVGLQQADRLKTALAAAE